MVIHGIQKLTLLDFPGKVACTLFTGGCNFRCPFCHNASLVLDPGSVVPLDNDDIFRFLRKRRGVLDGVCITGGEPLLNRDIPLFMRQIKDLGYLVKLDTNGSFPGKLKDILDNRLADYVAMDVKSSRGGYSKAAGVPVVDMTAIEESIKMLMDSGTDYEFRTTVVKGIHTAEDFEGIGELIRGAKRYFIQSYKDSGDVIQKFDAFSGEELKGFLEKVREYVPSAELRGVD